MRLSILAALAVSVLTTATATAQTSTPAPSVTGPYILINGNATSAGWIASGTRIRHGELARITTVTILTQPRTAEGMAFGRTDIRTEYNCATGQRRNLVYAVRGMDDGVLRTGPLNEPWSTVDRTQFGAALTFDYVCRDTVPSGPQPTDLGTLIRDHRGRYAARP